ncbi:Putative uncharacterized transposon-derived protein F52C9.6 [Eumeta japonica]|uniref:Uncharacterized transposon-derived protein F52C9.6 n=1 Tax=Eumeta variegata TaxID=151549 RepID=A0A4C1U7G5_EUMVA|nr:Putative uncharacterized transposon-derived protein F52C9.6 [Eumeta japonica]
MSCILNCALRGSKAEAGRSIQYGRESVYQAHVALMRKNAKCIATPLCSVRSFYVQTDARPKIAAILGHSSQMYYSSPIDHRLVRATIQIIKHKKCRANFGRVISNLSTLQNQAQYLSNLTKKLENVFWEDTDDIETFYLKIETSIHQSYNEITTEKPKQDIISYETKELIKKRSELLHAPLKTQEERKELATLFKTTNKKLKQDYKTYRLKIIENNLLKTGSQKRAHKQLNSDKKWIPSLKSRKTTKTLQTREDLVKIASDFYKNLYDDENYEQCYKDNLNYNWETNSPVQLFNADEIIKNIDKLKIEKSPGPDNIPNEALKIGKPILIQHLITLFNKILETQNIPQKWGESRITLLYKKGDPQDIGNYRPISLLPTMYKLFAMCLEKRLEPDIEKHQTKEQAGFRPGFSTIDHIHTIEQIVEKYQEFKSPLYLAYVDYAKAFDSITHESIWQALKHQNIPDIYINIIKNIYIKSTSRVKLDRLGPKINIRRGVKQGDPLSPKLFIAVLQNIMKDLKWEGKGINIDGKYLSNLRFADDIVLFSTSSKQLEEMLTDLSDSSNTIGLQLNTSKTKVTTNSRQTPIIVNQTPIEYVDSYIYLEKLISFKSTRHKDELDRRINMSWKKFCSLKEILKSNLPLKLKKKVMDSCVLPCLTYGAQTWIYNKYTKTKIRTCQRSMERSILDLKLKDKHRSSDIRHKTKLINAGKHAQQLKWKWAGHMIRTTGERWTKLVTTWKGPKGKRARGRPIDRWTDDLRKVAGDNWIEAAGDRAQWRQLEEAYTREGP